MGDGIAATTSSRFFVALELIGIPTFVLAKLAAARRTIDEASIKCCLIGVLLLGRADALRNVVLSSGFSGSTLLTDVAAFTTEERQTSPRCSSSRFSSRSSPTHSKDQRRPPPALGHPTPPKASTTPVTTFLSPSRRRPGLRRALTVVYVRRTLPERSGLSGSSSWVLAALSMTVGDPRGPPPDRTSSCACWPARGSASLFLVAHAPGGQATRPGQAPASARGDRRPTYLMFAAMNSARSP